VEWVSIAAYIARSSRRSPVITDFMAVRLDDQWSYRGYRAVTLENEHIRADVFPELGAKIYNLVHKRTAANLMWHHPRLELRGVPFGASYDDNFCGGWDELLPNDAPGLVGGQFLPDHGELWCQPWEYSTASSSAEVSVTLRRPCVSITTIAEKTITLRAGESQLRFHHSIRNVGPETVRFLWKLHPALVIEDGDGLDIPGTAGEIVDPSFGYVKGPARFEWPMAAGPDGQRVDFSTVRRENGTRDFVYVRNLSDGWCALRRRRLGIGFGLAFPKDIFTSVWVFMTFGGWRGLNTLVLEPCTAVPKDLNEAIRLGQCSVVAPGAALDCDIRGIVFDGTDVPRGFHDDGTIKR